MDITKRPFLLSCIAAFTLYGCALSSKEVNIDQFKNPADFVEKVSTLRKGMSDKEFFEHLAPKMSSITLPNNKILDRDTIWKHVYGSQVQLLASPEELKRTKAKLIAPYTGYEVSYASVEESFSPGLLLNIKLYLKGHDLKVIVIFEENEATKVKELVIAQLEGTAVIDKVERIYIWDLLGNSIRGAANQSGKEIIKDLR